MAGSDDDAVAIFNRNTTDNIGALTYITAIKDNDKDGQGNIVDGMGDVLSVAVSPDSQNIYVTSDGYNVIHTFRKP